MSKVDGLPARVGEVQRSTPGSLPLRSIREACLENPTVRQPVDPKRSCDETGIHRIVSWVIRLPSLREANLEGGIRDTPYANLGRSASLGCGHCNYHRSFIEGLRKAHCLPTRIRARRHPNSEYLQPSSTADYVSCLKKQYNHSHSYTWR